MSESLLFDLGGETSPATTGQPTQATPAQMHQQPANESSQVATASESQQQSSPSAPAQSADASTEQLQQQQQPGSTPGVTEVASPIVAPLDPLHKEIQEKFGGRWRMVRTDPYDEYLKAVGVGLFSRKIAGKSVPDLEIYVREKKINVSLKATLHSQNYVLVIGEAVENLVEKSKQSVFTSYSNGKITQQLTPQETGWGKVQEIEMSVGENGELLMNYAAGTALCRRYFAKLPDFGITPTDLAQS